MLEPTALVLALCVIFLAGFTQSLTGFGFGLIAVPLLSFFISPKLAPPITLLEGLVLNAYILKNAYVAVQPRRISMLSVAGVLGVPIGTYILANFAVESVRIYIGVMTLTMAVLFLTGFRRTVQNEQLVSAPIGFVSGILSGSINMGGPPVILFFANQGLPRQVFRANIIAYFVALQLVGLPLMVYAGIMTTKAVVTSAILLPGLLIGGLAGGRFHQKVDDQFVRRVTLGVVSLAGVLSILNGLGVL
jgi:uncharacterized membrane protein YfcA